MSQSLEDAYEALLTRSDRSTVSVADGEHRIPTIDLSLLSGKQKDRNKCVDDVVKAASSLGIFQIVNHDVPLDARQQLIEEAKVSFRCKNIENKFHRRGNPKALTLGQFQWSESFHVPLLDINANNGFRWSVERFATSCHAICETLAGILNANMNGKSDPNIFKDNCTMGSCYVRTNRYPRCSVSDHVLGMLPHSDSDFLTVLHHDGVSGLEILIDGKWLAVKSDPKSLIVIVGDLFQVYSNDTYKSAKHRVAANEVTDRFSGAFFYCPRGETEISSSLKPSAYRRFTFEDYMRQNRKDLEATGNKVGLSRFRL